MSRPGPSRTARIERRAAERAARGGQTTMRVPEPTSDDDVLNLDTPAGDRATCRQGCSCSGGLGYCSGDR